MENARPAPSALKRPAYRIGSEKQSGNRNVRGTPWDVSKSGGDIEEGWWVIPIQWYESAKSKDSTYYLSKNRHMLDMRSVHLAPQGIPLIEHPVDKTTKHYTVKKEDHEMLMEFIASS